MLSFTDQLGRVIQLPAFPKRIISLVPSQTELLYDLDLDEEVVGITKFCIHPEEWFRNKVKVGGTKNSKPDIIKSLQPDLIIANKEENNREEIETLLKKYPVWISDVHDLNSALHMILSVGVLTNRKEKSLFLSSQIQEAFNELKNFLSTTLKDKNIRTAYLIWKDPYMTAGGDTFIHSIIRACGLQNVFEQSTRYPEINIRELKSADCELLLLSSEPYPFKEKHIPELQKHLPDTKIILVDGEMFSWYGSRLLHVPEYLEKLILFKV
jgi:ABC-type Fe3+-hydroxamate transport system substrate-binding protein